jgi:hypothetical protein
MREHPQPCRYEVQHLAHGLADRMECTAAAGTDAFANIDCHVLARQMLGKPVVTGRGFEVSFGR